MSIKTKIRLSYILVLFLSILILIIVFPQLTFVYALGVARGLLLLFLLSVFFVLLFFLAIEQFLTSPLKDFGIHLQKSWQIYQRIRLNNKRFPDEIKKLYHIIDSIIKNIEKKSAELKKAHNLEIVKFEFISTVSHQLRTPLTGIKWALDSMLERPDIKANEEAHNLIQETLITVNRANNVVNQLLHTIQLSSKKQIYKKELIHVEDTIQKVKESLLLFTKSKEIIIEIKKKKLNIPTIEGNSDNVHLVFDTVISNAVCYSLQKGHVTVDIDYEDAFVIVKVHDNGIGISNEEQKHLFDRFYRGKRAISMYTSGSGLGLHLARAVLGSQGGDISFVSTINKGTTFTIKLSIKQKGELESFIQY